MRIASYNVENLFERAKVLGAGPPEERRAALEQHARINTLALFARVTGGGVVREGVWGGKNGTLFPHFPTITSAAQAASDHAAIFADVDV